MVLPASPDHALPFESERPDRGVVFGTLLTLLLVVGGGPTTMKETLGGILVKTLAQKAGAAVAPMDEILFSAFFGNRRDAGVFLQIRALGEASALGAGGAQEPRAEDRTGSR